MNGGGLRNHSPLGQTGMNEKKGCWARLGLDRWGVIELVGLLCLSACTLRATEPLPAEAPSAEEKSVDTVVVRPAKWSDALHAWKDYRQSQGHRIAEVDAQLDPSAIRAAIAHLAAAQSKPLRYVLLAGDVSSQAATTVPTFYQDSSAMSQFGGDATIASDNPYGDLDEDGLPELAVGRIPADTPEQLRAALARVQSFEQQADYSKWRRDVHVVAGVGGFGPVADSMIELTTRGFLADRIPGWSDLSMTQASLASQYCPDPYRFSETCVGRMNQGGMFWVYIGHGHIKTLDYLRAGDDWLPILTAAHVPTVDVGQRPPIAVFLACYTGAFDATEDSLAEELVLSSTGPIAAIAASRVSGPYGLAMLSDGLLSSCFDQQTATLGEVVLQAKQRMLRGPESLIAPPESLIAPPIKSPTHQATSSQLSISSSNHTPPTPSPRTNQLQMIGALAAALSPAGYDLLAERREHVWQMNLLGDPLLQLCHPHPLELQIAERAAPGDNLRIAGRSDMAGKMSVELVWRRDQVRRDLDSLPVDLQTEAGRDAFQQRYQAANQRVLVQRELPLQAAGDFFTELTIPPTLPRGKYAIRCFVEGTQAWCAGYHELSVRVKQ